MFNKTAIVIERLRNPANSFQELSADAKKYIEEQEEYREKNNISPIYEIPECSDPIINELIKCDDETYNLYLENAKRQAVYFRGKPYIDIKHEMSGEDYVKLWFTYITDDTPRTNDFELIFKTPIENILTKDEYEHYMTLFKRKIRFSICAPDISLYIATNKLDPFHAFEYYDFKSKYDKQPWDKDTIIETLTGKLNDEKPKPFGIDIDNYSNDDYNEYLENNDSDTDDNDFGLFDNDYDDICIGLTDEEIKSITNDI